MTCAELVECRVVLNKSYGSCSFLRDHGSCALGKEVERRIQPLPAGPQPPLAFASCLLPFSCCEKQQLKQDIEQLTGSQLGKECDKAVYCHPYLT